MKPLLLLIDDDKNFVEDFTLLLESDFTSITAYTAAEGLRKVRQNNPDIVLLDLFLGGEKNGLDVLDKIMTYDKNLPVIIITDYGSIDTAVSAIQAGAFDYISKTPNMTELKLIIQKSIRQRSDRFYKESLKEEVQKHYHQLIGDSPPMQKLKHQIRLSASHLNTVLITGESGVGKEIVARHIHLHSPRSNAPFVPINCAAVPDNLLESELFGHEKGAFTGANTRKIGKFEIASEGIIFFDEISELDPDAQVKLLRVLQEKEFDRVGGNKTIQTDAKILAATNRDLHQMVSQGQFRSDLFYRLDVFPIHVPPLRSRKADIPALVDHFLSSICDEMKISHKQFSQEALDIFMNYNWPGNIRELRNYVTRAVILSQESETIKPIHLEQKVIVKEEFSELMPDTTPETWEEMDRLRKEMAEQARREVEKRFLTHLLEKFEGNVSRAAENIGINRTNFHKMMRRCGL